MTIRSRRISKRFVLCARNPDQSLCVRTPPMAISSAEAEDRANEMNETLPRGQRVFVVCCKNLPDGIEIPPPEPGSADVDEQDGDEDAFDEESIMALSEERTHVCTPACTRVFTDSFRNVPSGRSSKCSARPRRSLLNDYSAWSTQRHTDPKR